MNSCFVPSNPCLRNPYIIALGFLRHRILASDRFKRGAPVVGVVSLAFHLFDDERHHFRSHTDNSEIGRACNDLGYGRRCCGSLLAPLIHQPKENLLEFSGLLCERSYRYTT